MSVHWYFVINPVSGKGAGLNLWEKVKTELELHAVDFSFGISEYHQHTTKLVAEKYSNGIRNFIGIGGDGTLNEIVNAIFTSQQFSLNNPSVVSMLSVGTGNDWVRSHEKLTRHNLIKKLESFQTTPHDVGLVESSETHLHHYFINVAGVGLDGQVVQEIEKLNQSGKKGKLSYLQSLIKALTSFEAPKSRIFTDVKELYQGETLLLTASKGQYFGGGMHISPKAISNNGLLDLTIVKKDSKWVVFSQLYKLFNGKIETATFVDKGTHHQVEITTETSIPIQADGEFLGRSNHVKFSVLKQAILVLV